jgi:hypothetical protein
MCLPERIAISGKHPLATLQPPQRHKSQHRTASRTRPLRARSRPSLCCRAKMPYMKSFSNRGSAGPRSRASARPDAAPVPHAGKKLCLSPPPSLRTPPQGLGVIRTHATRLKVRSEVVCRMAAIRRDRPDSGPTGSGPNPAVCMSIRHIRPGTMRAFWPGGAGPHIGVPTWREQWCRALESQ